MSDDSSPQPPAASPAAPRPRRISNPRPKKQASPSKPADDVLITVDASVTPPPAAPAKFPEFPVSSEAPEGASPRGDWPEPEAPSSGAGAPSDNPKRKRRRKKGKGNGPQNAALPPEGENLAQSADESPESPPQQAQPSRVSPPPRAKLDAEVLAKCAWKIYLAEISEEGVALVGDTDAKELSRRCFRLAEIFMEEQSRRR